MGRKYQLGKRFQRMRVVCVIAIVLVMYVFNFLYQLLFPDMNRFLLGVICAVAAAVLAFGSWKLLGWCADHVWYQIKDDGLEMCRGGTIKFLPWTDFVEAGVDNTNILARMPAWFKLKDGRRLTLEQYIEGLGSLILDIIEHIEGHAEVSETLRERLKTAYAMQQKR